MEQIDYDIERLEREKESIESAMAVAQALVDCGIPRKLTKHWKPVAPESGYSMGETVVLKCGDKTIQKLDNTSEYAKSCKYRAKHGYIVLEFSKKDLRTLVDLMKVSDEKREKARRTKDAADHEAFYQASRAYQEFALKHVSIEKSVIKKLSTMC